MVHKQISKSIIFVLLLFSFYSCSYDGPTEVFNPDEVGELKPEILEINPSNFALAEYTKIKISGKDFGTGADSTSSNIVYFNELKGKIISESQTEIVVIPPNISGDVTIKIVVPRAFNIAKKQNYKIGLISTKIDAFLPTERILGIAVDAAENLYAAIKVGSKVTVYKVEPGKEKIEFGTAPFPITSEMRVGPNNEIYFLPGNKDLYKMSSTGGKASKYVSLPKSVKFFDFDKNQNIFCGGTKTGIYRISTDGSNITEVGSLADFALKSIRVFDGYVYFSAAYKGSDDSIPKNGVWKSKISSTDGNLGNAELVFDWNQSGSFSSSKMGTITLAVDGTIFIGCDNAENPIVVVHPDGTNEALYSDILFTKTLQFVWGNTNTLYHNVKNNDDDIKGVYKILITDWESAPYYGRQ